MYLSFSAKHLAETRILCTIRAAGKLFQLCLPLFSPSLVHGVVSKKCNVSACWKAKDLCNITAL